MRKTLLAAVLGAVVALCVGCLLAGCDPVGDAPPEGVVEIEATPGPDGQPILRTVS